MEKLYRLVKPRCSRACSAWRDPGPFQRAFTKNNHISLSAVLVTVFFFCLSARGLITADSGAAHSRVFRFPVRRPASWEERNTGSETQMGMCKLPWNMKTCRTVVQCIRRVCGFILKMLQSKQSKWFYFPDLELHWKIVKNNNIFFLISPLSLTALKPQGEVRENGRKYFEDSCKWTF